MSTQRATRDLRFLHHLDELARLVRSVGAPCWVAHHTSGALLGFDGFELRPPFHLAVPRGRVVHRHGHLVHRLRDVGPLDTATAFGLPCLSATRTLIELAPLESPPRLTAALDSALRDGGTAEQFLHRRVVELRRRGRPGLTTLLEVIAGSEPSRGGHSYLERAFLELVAELGLPRPLTQQVLGRRRAILIRVDCHFPGTSLVVELLGYTFHRSPMQMQADAERVNRLTLDGLTVLQFTYDDVVTRSPLMLSTLVEALRRAEE